MKICLREILAEATMLLAVLSFAALGLACGQVAAAAHDAKPAPVLLELFTSEGCSSCPPADELLKEIDRKQTSSGQLLIGLSEHVTYWNNLGWRDPYSADLYTARQSGYSERFNLEGVYTPQLVINGSEQVVGSDRGGLSRALHQEEGRGAKAQAILQIQSVHRVPDGLAVTYSLTGLPAGHSAELFAALADDMDRSSVLRGENGGRTLTHAAVVRSLASVGPARAVRNQQITVHLTTAAHSAQRQHLVLFAQEANFGPVLGVAEEPLSP